MQKRNWSLEGCRQRLNAIDPGRKLGHYGTFACKKPWHRAPKPQQTRSSTASGKTTRCRFPEGRAPQKLRYLPVGGGDYPGQRLTFSASRPVWRFYKLPPLRLKKRGLDCRHTKSWKLYRLGLNDRAQTKFRLQSPTATGFACGGLGATHILGGPKLGAPPNTLADTAHKRPPLARTPGHQRFERTLVIPRRSAGQNGSITAPRSSIDTIWKGGGLTPYAGLDGGVLESKSAQTICRTYQWGQCGSFVSGGLHTRVISGSFPSALLNRGVCLERQQSPM